jgi:hypothetical protein
MQTMQASPTLWQKNAQSIFSGTVRRSAERGTNKHAPTLMDWRSKTTQAHALKITYLVAEERPIDLQRHGEQVFAGVGVDGKLVENGLRIKHAVVCIETELQIIYREFCVGAKEQHKRTSREHLLPKEQH